MDVDEPMAMAPMPGGTARTGATVLCYECGVPIDGSVSAGALCADCIKTTIDITKGIQREAVLHFCRDCDRWLLPPRSWTTAAPESRQLLALCLKKLAGLNKVRLVDATFIYTEPHSRRLKVKLTVMESVYEGVLLQQSFEVIYVVAYQQCPECAKSWTANVWRANVQVRQKVPHKRTFLYLEQLILKHGAHRQTLNIKEAKDGIDFMFAHKNDAEKFLSFLESVVPIETKTSKQIISEDIHTSTKQYKFSWSCNIVPICRDDLVALPIKLSKQINIAPLVLCYKIGTAVSFLDPQTLQTADVSSKVYWRTPFASLAQVKELVEFTVLEMERTGTQKGRWHLCEGVVAPENDYNKTFFVRTHLNLHPGDQALGYMLTGSNFNSTYFDDMEASHTYGSTIPDVVLVKKHNPNRRKNKKRNWKLKRLAKDEGELLPKKADQERMDKEYEMFLQDVEDDTELRAALTLYKNTKAKKQKLPDPDAMSVAETDTTADDGTGINMEELMDDLDDLDIEDNMHED